MPPTTLYHYTGLDAFEKIIATKRIRATHYSSFDDEEELRLGAQMLLDAAKRQPVDPCDHEYRDFLVEGIEAFVEGQLQVFVLSFTEMCDSPFHWRNYSRGGVAIGFCGGRILRGFPIDISRRIAGVESQNPIRPDPANRLMQCRYIDRFNLPELVSRRFFSAQSYPAAFRNEYVRGHGAIYACLAISIYQTVCAIKGPGFVDDAEWRCVHINPDSNDYPVKTENGRDFIEMQFDPADFVQEVWVGPHDESRKCQAAIEKLRLQGLLRCSATVSRLPWSV